MKLRVVAFALVVMGIFAASANAILISIVNNLPGTFVDISTTGTLLTPPVDGTVSASTGGVGNALFPAGTLMVGENGGISLSSSTTLSPTNAAIPDAGAFALSQAILGYWDDLIQPGGSRDALQICPSKTLGGIYIQSTPGSSLIVQYRSMCVRTSTALRGPNPDLIDFEIKIFDTPIPTSPNIYAQILYADIQRLSPNGGASATIGYQDGGLGNNDYQWSFNAAGSVMDGTVLSIIPEPGTAALVALSLSALVRGRRAGRRQSANGR